MNSSVRILALETSTHVGSVCLLENDQLISERRSENQRAHSDFLNQAIEEILTENSLKLNDVDLFATGIGPGSFTGIRIALNAAKTFSYIFRKPLVAIDSLTLLAHGSSIGEAMGKAIGSSDSSAEQSRPVLTLINAYKNMTYTCVYQFKNSQWIQLREAEAVGVKSLSDWLLASPLTKDFTSFQVLGDGYKTYLPFFEPSVLEKMVRPEDSSFDFPLASTLGQLAYELFLKKQTMDWKLLRPLYIRASEAEETKRGLVFTPLK
jgi:tRNA threonylcarbamoyladenosine biosynthesis protein TsaB